MRQAVYDLSQSEASADQLDEQSEQIDELHAEIKASQEDKTLHAVSSVST